MIRDTSLLLMIKALVYSFSNTYNPAGAAGMLSLLMWVVYNGHMVYNKESSRRYREKNREKLRQHAREYRLEWRRKVFEHYGMSCAECGFSDYRALQLDHLNNDGAEERKSLGGQKFSGWRFYQHVVNSNYQGRYQTLCANCNSIKQWEQSKYNNGSIAQSG